MYTIDKGYDGSTAETFNWQTESPTELGWYWAMLGSSPELVCVVTPELPGAVWVTGEDETRRIKDFTHWLGPLLVPDLPEDKRNDCP